MELNSESLGPAEEALNEQTKEDVESNEEDKLSLFSQLLTMPRDKLPVNNNNYKNSRSNNKVI